MVRLDLLQLRMSAEEKELVKDLATKSGCKNISEYLRNLLMQQNNVFEVETKMKKYAFEIKLALRIIERSMQDITNDITGGITKNEEKPLL
ncbi:hypothetical protein HZA97_07260 [Candidatus Woesearchaeota archaeon]|nr:hypothetical protein [Candidatus Woesearchaeota archaeon]